MKAKYFPPLFFFFILLLISCNKGYIVDETYSNIKADLTDFKTETLNNFSNQNVDADKIWLDVYSTCERLNFSVSFEITSENPTIQIGRDNGGYIECNDSLLTVYRLDDRLSKFEIHEHFENPIKFRKGEKYTVSCDKVDGYILKYSIVSDDAKFEKSYDKRFADIKRVAIGWGKPFFIVNKGTVKILDASVSSDYSYPYKLTIVGDSFIEGASIINYGLDNRWCALLAKEIGYDFCPIIGKGGEVMNKSFISRFKIENEWFNSPYVILSLGTNHRTVASVTTYKDYMRQAIKYLKGRGQTPVLVTVTPLLGVDYDTVTKAMNDWVKNSGELYIDMHKAVTNPSNPEQWKKEYVQCDGVHPTIEGHAAMYRQVLIDCPQLGDL